MADEASLRAIGFVFATVTTVIALVAVSIVGASIGAL
jgi:hypothetical protein